METKIVKQLLSSCSQGNNVEIVVLLDKFQQATNVTNHCMQKVCINAIMHALRNGHAMAIQEILKSGAFQESQDADSMERIPDLVYKATFYHGNPSWFINILASHVSQTKKPLKMAEILNLLNRDGFSALHLAAEEGNVDIAERLVAVGIDTRQTTRDGNTALSLSIANGHKEFWEFILAFSDINSWDADHDTPLMYACKRGESELVKHLLEKGAHYNALNRYGTSALWNAIFEGAAECVKEMIVWNSDFRVQCRGTELYQQTDDESLLNLNRTSFIYPSDKSLLWVVCDRLGASVEKRSRYLTVLAMLLTSGYDVSKERWIARFDTANRSDMSELPRNILDDKCLLNLLTFFFTRPLRLQVMCRNALRTFHIDRFKGESITFTDWISHVMNHYPLSLSYLTMDHLHLCS